MKFRAFILTSVLVITGFSTGAVGQVDEFCKEFGFMASLDAPRLTAPYIYGRIAILGNSSVSKFPTVLITYSNRSQSPTRQTVGKSGTYCFKITEGNGGSLLIEIDGVEVARRDVPDFGPAQRREDFQVTVPGAEASKLAPPGVVSTKFIYPPNEKTAAFYREAAEAELKKDLKAAIEAMQKVVAADEQDFPGWAQLANLYFQNKELEQADAAYRRALALREDYTPAWINIGKLRVAQKQFAAAIEIFKHAAALEPENARTFRLLGEAYLQNKQGTLGAQALNHAIRLDPFGQAECHLQLAHLYQLAGAKVLAAGEYKKFLAKIPEHPERKKFERFIRENPD
ncbi:MAG TPA: tetratricopeptide repeat protein [Pyrinomonadaceae bacterium]